MAETSLGRASLSVTADLSGFTTALDSASQKTNELTATNDVFASAANKVTVATEQQTKALADLQEAAVQGAINLANNKQQILATKLATDALVQQDGATLILMQDQKKLEAEQAKLITSNKALENSLLKNDQAFRNNTFEIQKNIQKQQLYELNQKNLLARMSAVDQESVKMTAIQKRLTTETDIAAKKMDLQARQMLIESGAAVKLAKELAELEDMEQSIIAAETTIQNQFKKTTKEMETAAQATSNVVANQKIEPPKQQKFSLNIKDYLGIGAATAAFTKLFDMIGAGISRSLDLFKTFGQEVISAGSKFESANKRLTALTGDAGLAKGLQDIMRFGPSAGFEALTEHATRLAALKFNPASIQDLIGKFNTLGVALGNPERIMALIVDKIGDMAADGQATMPALSKLAEEGIPVWDALAARLTQTTGRFISVAEAQQMVTNGMVSVSEASAAIGDAANMQGIQTAANDAANSFSGAWATAAANVQAVFQKIGSTILEGFSLNSLGGGITDFFNFVMEKIDAIGPLLQGVGAFVSSVVDIVLTGMNEFLSGWEVTTGEMTIDDIVLAAQEAALDFVQSIYDFGKGIFDFFKPVDELFGDLMFLINSFTTGMKVVWGFLQDITGKATEWVVWVLEKIGMVEKGTTDQLKKAQEEAKRLEKQREQQPATGADKYFQDQRKRLSDIKMNKPSTQNEDPEFWLDQMFGKAEKNAEKLKPKINDLGKATKDAAENAKKFAENMKPTNVIRTEEAPWKKFLAENLTPLQQYENEIAKLNMMLDGSEEGFAAFAMGSANALKKLKDATGLGEVKFAAAITAGSAEDFKATLDAQNQNVDVQQQIRELMQAAQEIQQQQLDAQIEIANAIKNQRMPKPVNVMGG